MFNPEFRYLIPEINVQDNGLINGDIITTILGSTIFTTIFVVLGINFILINILIAVYNISNKILILVYKGYSNVLYLIMSRDGWQELSLIATIIFLGVIMFLTMNEFTKQLDESFTNLKTKIKEKEDRINELELELTLFKTNKLPKNKLQDEDGDDETDEEDGDDETDGEDGDDETDEEEEDDRDDEYEDYEEDDEEDDEDEEDEEDEEDDEDDRDDETEDDL